MYWKIAFVYFLVISLIAIIMTVSDKWFAIKGRYRISEKALLTVGFLGGALAMYIIMKLIRHKTLKAKFMVTLPIFIILHIGSVIFVLTYSGVI